MKKLIDYIEKRRAERLRLECTKCNDLRTPMLAHAFYLFVIGDDGFREAQLEALKASNCTITYNESPPLSGGESSPSSNNEIAK